MYQKKCRRCGKRKSNEDFNKNKRNKDGLCDYCKTCLKDYRVGNILPYKYCYKCKKLKSKTKFSKVKSNPDGLDSICIECNKIEKAFDSDKNANDIPGIYNLEQLDGVIREMAELECGINQEKTKINNILTQQNSTIKPWLAHQADLRNMLLSFLKRNKIKKFNRRYFFGVVIFSRGKLEISLKPDLAKQMMEKP